MFLQAEEEALAAPFPDQSNPLPIIALQLGAAQKHNPEAGKTIVFANRFAIFKLFLNYIRNGFEETVYQSENEK